MKRAREPSLSSTEEEEEEDEKHKLKIAKEAEWAYFRLLRLALREIQDVEWQRNALTIPDDVIRVVMRFLLYLHSHRHVKFVRPMPMFPNCHASTPYDWLCLRDGFATLSISYVPHNATIHCYFVCNDVASPCIRKPLESEADLLACLLETRHTDKLVFECLAFVRGFFFLIDDDIL